MRHAGVDSGPVVAEKEAEAAVAAAREAAHHQHEQALQRCNADWTARLGRQSHLLYLHKRSPNCRAIKCAAASTQLKLHLCRL